jgi:hypothetical protein
VEPESHADLQEDETDFQRRMDAEEDLLIDVLTPDQSFPRAPVSSFADEEPDDDTWEGFYPSLDLFVDGAEDEENDM